MTNRHIKTAIAAASVGALAAGATIATAAPAHSARGQRIHLVGVSGVASAPDRIGAEPRNQADVPARNLPGLAARPRGVKCSAKKFFPWRGNMT